MSDHRTAARQAWLYALPLIEIAQTRARSGAMGQQPNSFLHMRKLADHRARLVTAPNNDTIYSSAQIDLSAGPVTITLPPSGDRYLSLALMDAYSNHFAILGTRTTGRGGGTFRIIGPGDASDGPNDVRSPTRHVWALVRIFVEGPDDLDAAAKVQGGVSIQGPAVPRFDAPAHRGAPWQEYFASVDALLASDPPPVTDRALLERIAPLGLGKGDFDPSRFDAAQAAEIEAGVAEARQFVRRGNVGADVVDGWAYGRPELGAFGQSYDYRAAIALFGLAGLPPHEAMYMSSGVGTRPYDGARDWSLRFADNAMPPVDAFWSISLYEITAEGQLFFTDNPIRRYIINSRTPGLHHEADGSLEIRMGRRPPDGALAANWLPAPDGPFALIFRAYLPRPELLDGRWRVPPVTEVPA